MKKNVFEIYLSEDGWRWKLKAKNGQIIAKSGKGSVRKPDINNTGAKVYSALIDATVMVYP